MSENKPRRDAFVLAAYNATPEGCAVDVRFDIESGRHMFLNLLGCAASRLPNDATTMDFLWFDPNFDAERVHVRLRPFGPFHAVADDAFVEARGTCVGITAAQSRDIVESLVQGGILDATRRPQAEYLLTLPSPPLPLPGLSPPQLAGIASRIVAHADPVAYAEWDPIERALWIVADIYVLQSLYAGIESAMGRTPVVGMQERLRIFPDPRFCFVPSRPTTQRVAVTSLNFVGHYTGPDNAQEHLIQFLSDPLHPEHALVYDI